MDSYILYVNAHILYVNAYLDIKIQGQCKSLILIDWQKYF